MRDPACEENRWCCGVKIKGVRDAGGGMKEITGVINCHDQHDSAA